MISKECGCLSATMIALHQSPAVLSIMSVERACVMKAWRAQMVGASLCTPRMHASKTSCHSKTTDLLSYGGNTYVKTCIVPTVCDYVMSVQLTMLQCQFCTKTKFACSASAIPWANCDIRYPNPMTMM